MNYPIQAMIAAGAVSPISYPANSRYVGTGTCSYTPAGAAAPVRYLQRRFVPAPGAPNFATVATHRIRAGDRPDLLAARYLGDPLLSWLLLDSNGGLDPDALTAVPGSTLNITTPQGVAGVSGA